MARTHKSERQYQSKRAALQQRIDTLKAEIAHLEAPVVKLRTLGDVLGSLLYMGKCPKCGVQHMSRHDRVYVVGSSLFCENCPPRLP